MPGNVRTQELTERAIKVLAGLVANPNVVGQTYTPEETDGLAHLALDLTLKVEALVENETE